MERKSIEKNAKLIELQPIMAEGVQEADNILSKVISLTMDEVTAKTKHYLEFMQARIHAEVSLLLSLDDMNIRGQQIVDAYEWAQGDAQKLHQAFQSRNTDMIQYINARAAERYMEAYELQHKAVEHGASFIKREYNLDLLINRTNVNDFLQQIIKREIDYSKLDIMKSGTSLKEGIRIAEAHGFQLGLDVVKEDLEAYDVHHLLFINDKDDILIAKATANNFCYGGCEIRGARYTDQRYGVGDNLLNFQQNFYKHEEQKFLQFSLSYQDNNLFQMYEKYLEHDDHVVSHEYREVGVRKGIPIPEFFYSHDTQRDLEEEKIYSRSSLESFFVTNIMNMIKLEEYIPQMSEKCKKIYGPIAKKSIELALQNNIREYGGNDAIYITRALPYIQKQLGLSSDRMHEITQAIQTHLSELIIKNQQLIELGKNKDEPRFIYQGEDQLEGIQEAQDYLEEQLSELKHFFAEYEQGKMK